MKKEREIIELLEKEEQWRSSGGQPKEGHHVGKGFIFVLFFSINFGFSHFPKGIYA